jgi:hypothetical protein
LQAPAIGKKPGFFDWGSLYVMAPQETRFLAFSRFLYKPSLTPIQLHAPAIRCAGGAKAQLQTMHRQFYCTHRQSDAPVGLKPNYKRRTGNSIARTGNPMRRWG